MRHVEFSASTTPEVGVLHGAAASTLWRLLASALCLTLLAGAVHGQDFEDDANEFETEVDDDDFFEFQGSVDEDDFFEIQSAVDAEPIAFDGMTVAGARFPHTVRVEDGTLHLTGAGARKEARLVMYSMGFYAQGGDREVEELIDADEPAIIRMETVSSLITPARFSKAVRLGFDKSTGGDIEQFETEITQFLSAVGERFKRGEVVELIYAPGIGTQVLRNGEPKTTVAGLPFKRALFGIWLGDDPIDAALKEDLLRRGE